MVLSFDKDAVLEDSFCQVLDEDEYYSSGQRKDSGWFDLVLAVTPVVAPALGGLLYPSIETLYHVVSDVLSFRLWESADGGFAQTQALIPLVNGIVVPACSVALGTLTALTVSQLRQRQIQLRTLLNKEACLIRCILCTFEALFQGDELRAERRRGILLLRQYTSRVLSESRYGVDVEKLERLGASDSELEGVLRHLAFTRRLGEESENVNVAFASPTVVRELMMVRSERLALLQTSFPSSHWAILTLLAASVIGAFLFESDQEALRFLNGFQLRVLFTILTGALASTASLCADLNDPFRGSFRITANAEQLALLRATMEGAMCA